MKYSNYVEAQFVDRPNRFVAHVKLNSEILTVHVKNTGRCKELLIPGVNVILTASDNPLRKTAYDLIAVYKENVGWINIDSQAPNTVVKEWLATQGYSLVKPEYTYGKSRVDFYMEKDGIRYLMEVKGCTLERNMIGYFPDAPTERGRKHVYELAGALDEGFKASIAFVVQMNGINEVRPNSDTDSEFADALKYAFHKGVDVLFLCCDVTKDELLVTKCIKADDIR